MDRASLLALSVLTVLWAAPAPATGSVVKNIDYVDDTEYADGRDELDVYAPDSGEGHPVVVFFHGGGLRGGEKGGSEHVGRALASAGIVAVIPNYRLSPSVKHPSHVEDAARAIAWTRDHVAAHHGDPSRIYVSGHSAGAYLAVLLALDERYLEAVGMDPAALAGIIPISGFFYVDEVAPDRPKDVWGADEHGWRDASPASYLRAGAPPHLFLYADGDDAWRREQNERFARELEALGNEAVAVTEIEARDHVGIWQRLGAGDPALDRLLAFVADS